MQLSVVRHALDVLGVAWSVDDKLIATASADGTIQVGPAAYACVNSYPPHMVRQAALVKPPLTPFRTAVLATPWRGWQVEELASVQIWDVEVLVGVVWDRRTLVAKLGLHRDQANGNYCSPLRAACSNQSTARAWLPGRGGCMGSKRSVLGLGIVGRYSAGKAVYCG